MSQSQVQQRPAAANGVGRRRPDRDVGNSRSDSGFRSESQNWRSSQQGPSRSSSGGAAAAASGSSHGLGHFNSMNVSSNTSSAASGIGNRGSGERPESGGATSVARGGAPSHPIERPLHDRLLFMAMCLIGQPVEVQVKNGSFYSGIFHTANVEKDFGIVLKMARLTRDGSVKGGKSEAVKEAARKAPQKTLIIQAKDFVQIIAKDVSLSGDAFPNGRTRENKAEIVTDAVLSQGRHRDGERELKPWKPDDENPRPVGLETTFQNSWNRNWDQFETNKNLFGVETTFNEELYTTKLERGPQMREREREASRIAREIEGTATKNLHLAEERGIRLGPELEGMDEESRFSSVIRREKVDVGEDGEDRHMDDRNEETFGASFGGAGGNLASPTDSTVSTPMTAESESKASRPSSADSTQGGGSPYHSPVGRGSPLLSPLVGDAASIQALNLDPSSPQLSEEVYRDFHEFKLQETAKKGKKQQREDEVKELKSFSESYKKKEMEPRSPRNMPKASVGEPISSSRHGPQDGVARSSSGSLDNKSITPSSVTTATGPLTAAQASAPPASALPIPVALGSQSSAAVVNVGVAPKTGSVNATSGNSYDISAGTAAAAAGQQSSAVLPHNGLPVHPSMSGNFGAPAPITVPSVTVSRPPSPTVSPSSSVSSAASPAPFGSKRSSLNPNAKEFKLNPNAKAFTPNFSSPRSASPMIQGPVYMHAGHPPAVAQMQGVPVGMSVGQYVQQPAQQPAQFTQYNNAMAAAAAAASSSQYMPPPGSYPPNAGGPPVIPAQPGLKMPPHSPQQVLGPPYGQQQQQQQMLHPSRGHPMQPQPAYMHPNYPQQMMYGGQQQVLYIQQFQGMMQGQPVPPPPQGPLPPQPSQQSQQQKHRGGGMQQMHYAGGGPSLPGQHHLPQPPVPHLHNSLQPNPGGLAPVAIPGVQAPQVLVPSTGGGGGGNALRGGKGGSGGYSQQ